MSAYLCRWTVTYTEDHTRVRKLAVGVSDEALSSSVSTEQGSLIGTKYAFVAGVLLLAN